MNINTIIEQVNERKFAFLGTFFIVFTLSYMVLLALDMLPEPPAEEEVVAVTAIEESEVVVTEEVPESVVNEPIANLPISIKIDKLDKEIVVLNPESREIADLDAALLNGVVRHPDSAHLQQDGNVFILGHSSYLPNVFNRNFQAFNGIQNLEWGDTIELASEDATYIYRVERVYRAQAQDVTVPIAGDEKLLTIATCNSFGSVDDRYIVEAKQIEVKSM